MKDMTGLVPLLCFLVGGGFVGYLTNLHSQLHHQTTRLQELLLNTQTHGQTLKIEERRTLAHKYVVRHVTPLKDQSSRGTCWDFSSIAVLEHTYRKHGIEQGWLEPDEYLALSEQAYGKEVLRLCSGSFDSPQQQSCRVPDDKVWKNSTNGGENADLYYLKNGLKDNVYPHRICPYYKTPSRETDNKCDGLTEEARQTNPLLFDIGKMETYYDILTTKKALFKPAGNPDSPLCELCPAKLSMSTCCIALGGGSNHNMEGEFLASSGMGHEGGHDMAVVGYNDAFRTNEGDTGGFILKNSWSDDGVTGSHSIRYWMQEVSDWEERVICPNSHSPRNWYSCGNADPVVHSDEEEPKPVFNRSRAFREGIEACISEETKAFAEINYQPLELKCKDSRYCSTDPNIDYYVRNSTSWGDSMTLMCLFEYNTVQKTANDFCLPPLIYHSIAEILSPVKVHPNDPDQCGFYFISYEVLNRYILAFGGFHVTNFNIKWSDQSYAANRADYPELNYSLIDASTRKQRHFDFVGPFPFARQVSTEALVP